MADESTIVSSASAGAVFGGGASAHRHTGESQYFLARIGLEQDQAPQRILLPFLPHGLTPSPHDERLMVLFEKHGPGGCVVDLVDGRVVHTLQAGPGREFYGHGVFSKDGSLLFCTETVVGDGYRGVIAVRDGKDFSDQGEFPSFGVAPHDCMLDRSGDVLVVANGGSPLGSDRPAPNVVFVDIHSRTLLDSLEPSNGRINTGHIAMARGGELAVVSAPRAGLAPETHTGGVSLWTGSGPLRTVSGPTEVVEALTGETLSVAIHEPSRTVAATTPVGHYLTFWDLDSGALRGSLRVPNPRGVAVTLDQRAFIVNYGNPPMAAYVDAQTLRPMGEGKARHGRPSACTGSHIMVADLPGWAADPAAPTRGSAPG